MVRDRALSHQSSQFRRKSDGALQRCAVGQTGVFNSWDGRSGIPVLVSLAISLLPEPGTGVHCRYVSSYAWLSRGVGISRAAAGEQEARQRDHAAVRRLRRTSRIAAQQRVLSRDASWHQSIDTPTLPQMFCGPHSLVLLYFLDYASQTQRTGTVSGSVPRVLTLQL
jgi:hypothetical protein